MTAPDGSARAEKTLTLFVAGHSRRALDAMGELRGFVDGRRDKGWRLEVVDVLQPGAPPDAGDVWMTPTLVARIGGVERRFVGCFDELGLVLETRTEARRP